MTSCPYCKSTTGQVRAGKNPSGSQRILCKVCERKYTPSPTPIGYPEILRKQAILMCLDGQSFRTVARKLDVNHQTIVNWINNYMKTTSRAIYGLREK
jgi:transposase-like protein